MLITKKFSRDKRTELVSKIFDEVLISSDLHLPFEKIELHIRDTNISVVDEENAIVSINYNDPLVLDSDIKGIRIILMHELFRLMFKFDLPKPIEDVIVGREMIKRGFGNGICYMYFNRLAVMKVETVEDYINVNLPWIIFYKYDEYNSEMFKKIASRICKKKFPQCQRLFDLLINLSQKNLHEAESECKKWR